MENVTFLASNDARVTSEHLRTAMQIAEGEFETQADASQVQIDGANVRWTIETIPFCWTILLVGDQCIGSVAILPTSAESKRRFMAGEISEKELFEIAQSSPSEMPLSPCLYLTAVTLSPTFQKRGIGEQALLFTIEMAQKNFPNAKQLYCLPYNQAGSAFIKKVEARNNLRIEMRGEAPASSGGR